MRNPILVAHGVAICVALVLLLGAVVASARSFKKNKRFLPNLAQ